MSLAQKTIRGLKWQAVEVVGRQLLGLVVFTTLARLLDPAAFGLVGMVGVYLAFVSMFVDQGIGTALIQRKDLHPDHLHTAFWFNLGCAGLICALTMALAGPVALLFAEPQLEPLLRWASLGLVFGAAGRIHSTVFMRDMDYKRPAMRVLVAQLAGGLVGVTMALLDYGVWALIGQQLVAALAGTIFLWIASTYRPRPVFSIARLRELFGMSSAVFATGILWFIASRADQFFIGRGLGAATLGLYVVGNKLPELGKTALQAPLGTVTVPAFSRLQNDHTALSDAIIKAVTLSSLVYFPAFIGLAAVGHLVVPILFGQAWQESVPVLQLASIYILTGTVFAYCHPALVATSSLKKYVYVNIGCATGAVLVSWLGSRYSVESVLIGLTVNLFLTGIVALLYLRQVIGLSPLGYLRACLKPLMASLVMASALVTIDHHLDSFMSIEWRLLVALLVGLLLYTITAFLFCRESVTSILQLIRQPRKETSTTLAAN